MQTINNGSHERIYPSRSLITALILISLVFRLYFYSPPPIYTGTEATLTGRVLDISYRENSQNLVATDLFTDESSLAGSVVIKTRLYPFFSIGDIIQFTGNLKQPPSYLHLRGVSALSNYPHLKKLQQFGYGSDNKFNAIILSIRRQFFIWRHSLVSRSKKILPEPHSYLLAGILFGYSNIPLNFSEALKSSGTTHIVVASGFNFVVVVTALTSIAFLFGRWGALLFSVFGIVFYAFVVGGTPPVVRAALMSFLAFLGQFLGRQPDSRFALLFSSAFLLHFRPGLLWNISFQLTFCATLGILYISPFIVKYIHFVPKAFRNIIAETWSAQVATYPVLFGYFAQKFSFASLLCNVLVITAIPFLTWLGFAAVLSSYVIRPVGRFFSFLLYTPLEYVVSVINLFS